MFKSGPRVVLFIHEHSPSPSGCSLGVARNVCRAERCAGFANVPERLSSWRMTSIFPSRESRQGDDDRGRKSVPASAYFQRTTASSVETWYLTSFYEYTLAGFNKILKALKSGEVSHV